MNEECRPADALCVAREDHQHRVSSLTTATPPPAPHQPAVRSSTPIKLLWRGRWQRTDHARRRKLRGARAGGAAQRPSPSGTDARGNANKKMPIAGRVAHPKPGCVLRLLSRGSTGSTAITGRSLIRYVSAFGLPPRPRSHTHACTAINTTTTAVPQHPGIHTVAHTLSQTHALGTHGRECRAASWVKPGRVPKWHSPFWLYWTTTATRALTCQRAAP